MPDTLAISGARFAFNAGLRRNIITMGVIAANAVGITFAKLHEFGLINSAARAALTLQFLLMVPTYLRNYIDNIE